MTYNQALEALHETWDPSQMTYEMIEAMMEIQL